MKKLPILILAGIAVFGNGAIAAEGGANAKPVDYANLLLGTDIFPYPELAGHNSLDPDFGLFANEIVGPRMPDGMVSPSPLTSFRGVTAHARGAGYCHSDKYIIGFSQLNTEYNSYMNPVIMPVVGRLYTVSGDADGSEGYRVEKDSSSEIAKPYYYAVKLKNGVKAEITATKHVGIYRYTFPKSFQSKILLDLGATHRHSKITDAWVRVVDNTTVEGYQKLRLIQCFNYYGENVYFVAKFDKPFRCFALWKDKRIFQTDSGFKYVEKSGGVSRLGMFADYCTSEGEQIQVKIAISPVSIEDARAKLEAEAPSWNFEAIAEKGKEVWNNMFSKIQVEGGTDAQKALFYTSMLRCAKFANVENISMLSTMNYQVLFLLDPESIAEKIRDIVKTKYVRRGFFGNGFVPYSLSFYRRGVKDVDLKAIYELYFKMVNDPKYERYAEFIKYGYLPYIHRENGIYEMNDDCANRTLGYAYEFYCLAEMAKEIGRPQSEIDFLLKHSKNYKNLLDPETGFIRAKTADGKWLEPFDPAESSLRSPYNEGNSWQYTYMILHDIPELIKITGGNEAFVAKLDKIFTTPNHNAICDVSGMIGCYTHGNGNDRFIPYLYVEAGAPYKTQKMVRYIMDTMYKNAPGALPNNDDYGNLSGWYVMSAMGLYPPINAAAADDFVLGSPLFKKITLRLPEYIYGGNTFTIECENYAPENIYVEWVELDGKRLDNFKMPIDALRTGKKLVFKMSPKPVIK